MHGDSVALATRQRTGSVWGKRKDGEEWIANTERRVLPPKTFTFIRCVATYNENSVVTLFSHTDLFQIVRRGKQIPLFFCVGWILRRRSSASGSDLGRSTSGGRAPSTTIYFIPFSAPPHKLETEWEKDCGKILRRCPVCQRESIIGHGRRCKQAHDRHHDWIPVHRGRCTVGGQTF